MDRPLVAGVWQKRQSRQRCLARVMPDTDKAKNGRLWKSANPKQVLGFNAYSSCVPQTADIYFAAKTTNEK